MGYGLAAALLVCAGAAEDGGPVVVAEEPGAATAPALAAYVWTGFCVGLSAISGTFSDNGGVTSDGADGLGVQVGYLRDFGRLVVGGEFACASGDFDASRTTTER